MPLFIYQAVDQAGRTRTGEIQADDKVSAILLLERQHLTPFSVVPAKGARSEAEGGGILPFSFFQRISAVDKILLTKHLAAVIKGGISLSEALEILWEDAEKPLLKKVLFDAKTNLERGQSLSVTFAMYPKYFPPVFVGIVRAGEKSGTLEEALNNLGEQLTKDYELTSKVRSAMVYPSILLAASTGVIVLLLTFLLPRLIKVFGQTKITLPFITRFFVAISNILSAYPLLTFGFFVAVMAAAVLFLRSSRGRERLVGYLQKVPVTKDIIRKLVFARLTRTFKNLLRSGLGALEALEITAQTVGNKVYQMVLLEIREDIKKGVSLTDAFRRHEKLFPRLLISMLTVGERTGGLEKSLETISAFYDEEADRSLKTLVSLLEPALLIVMGLVVGGIAISVLIPIYQLMGSVR